MQLDSLEALAHPVATRVFLIAEIGINHNGDMAIAKRLIDAACDAGWDAVKFQKRTIDIVYTPEILDGPRESPWGDTQRAQKEGLEFGHAEYDEIDRYCREKGIEWFASAWDIPSQEFLRDYDLKYNKVASAMVTHPDFLRAVASEKRMTFVSTGMSEMDDVSRAVDIFREADCPFVLMHSVSEYPAPEETLNLSMIGKLREKYDCPVGYSGHETSIAPSVMAAMLGAVAIERHITLDRAMYGSDQAASLEQRGVQLLARYIRSIPVCVGDGVKQVTETEKAVAAKLRYWPDNDDA